MLRTLVAAAMTCGASVATAQPTCDAFNATIDHAPDGFVRARLNRRLLNSVVTYDAPVHPLGYVGARVQVVPNELFDGKSVTNPNLLLITSFTTVDAAKTLSQATVALVKQCAPQSKVGALTTAGFVEFSRFEVARPGGPVTLTVSVIEQPAGKWVATTRVSSANATAVVPANVERFEEAMSLVEDTERDSAMIRINALAQDNSLAEQVRGLRAVTMLESSTKEDLSGEIAALLTANPRNYYAMLARGLLKQSKKDYVGAIADFDSAIAIDGRRGLAHHERAWTRSQLDHPVLEVLDDYDRGLARNWTSSSLTDAGNACRIDKGPFARCVEYYELALRLFPDKATANFGWAEMFYAGDDPRERDDRDFKAKLANAYRITLEYQPKNLRALKHRAYYLRQLEEYGESNVMLTRAIAAGDDDAWTYRVRASNYLRLGENENAIADLDKSLKLEPGNENALKNRQIAVDRIAEAKRPKSLARGNALNTSAQADYDALIELLTELDKTYQRAVAELDRADRIDAKNKNVANLRSMMTGPLRRGQTALDRAHEAIKTFLDKWGGKIDDETVAQLNSWKRRLPTYIS